QVATATEYWILYRAANVPIRWRMNLALFYAGGLGNYLPLQAGSVYRFHFMKAVHGVGYSRTVSVFGQNFVITIAAAGTVIITGVLTTAAFTTRSLSWIMLVVGIAMVSGAIVLAVVPLPHIRWLRGRPARWWSEFHEGWETLRREPRVAVRVLLLEVVCSVTFALRLALVFDLLGVHAPFFLCLALAPVASPATALAITPGALGFREAAVAGAAVAMGFRVPTGIFAAGIDRGVLLLVTVVFGVGGYVLTLPHLRRARREAAVADPTPTAARPPG
ncbi:MAG TPA: lysylphosphatidylglycerol synthase transmembrane domain-containing protein, partial [Acidimicrobiia bacterium]